MALTEAKTSGAWPRAFPPTRWSLVLAATQEACPESAAALETVCRAYWYPLYGYARRCGQSAPDAQDITQEFFRLLLEKRWLDDADRSKGRLRSFLITAMKRFMANHWRRLSSQRRGGARTQLAIDSTFAEGRYAADPGGELGADEHFDRQWALRLLELTMERLEAEFNAADKLADFGVLKEFLAVSHARINYQLAGSRLGLKEGAARVAVHRLRRRFRELYRDEVSQTLLDGESLDSELRYLARVISKS